jgi:hypothetical protein
MTDRHLTEETMNEPKILETVLLSTCRDGDEVRLPDPVGNWVLLSRAKPIQGDRLQVKYRQSRSGNVMKADLKGDPHVERRRVPVSEADFEVLALMKEGEARIRCQRHGMRPDDLTEAGQPKWTLFTEAAIRERERLRDERAREEQAAKRAEIDALMPLSMDEIMADFAAAGILPGAWTETVTRMLGSSPAYGSAALPTAFLTGGLLTRVG